MLNRAVDLNTKQDPSKFKMSYPLIGLGTYPLIGRVCSQAVRLAIEVGYQLIDTATYYKNFDAIAEAIQGKERDHLYITSKVWPDNHSPEGLRRDCLLTLEELKTDYLDTYLLHWPNSHISIEATLGAMEELRREGKIFHIGLSNVSVNHLIRALEVGVSIAWVQIEMHPFFCDRALLNLCRAHSIGVQAWRPLDLGRVSQDSMLVEIGKTHNKTACQVALRWIIQNGCTPLPGSANRAHLEENLSAAYFILSQEEMERIDARAEKGVRFRLKKERGLGFTDEFDFSYQECWPKPK